MVWAKVDDRLHSSAKWRTASRSARGLWTTALSWCADQETDGFVPSGMIPVLDGTAKDAGSLVLAGLWSQVEGGWQFRNWAEYQPTRSDLERRRTEDAERKRKAREAKAARNGTGVTTESEARPPGLRPESALTRPDPTRPDPTPTTKTEEGGEPPIAATPAPWCSKHPGGTDAACGPCRTARLVWEQTITEADNADKGKPTPAPWSCATNGHQEHRTVPGICRHCSERVA